MGVYIKLFAKHQKSFILHNKHEHDINKHEEHNEQIQFNLVNNSLLASKFVFSHTVAK